MNLITSLFGSVTVGLQFFWRFLLCFNIVVEISLRSFWCRRWHCFSSCGNLTLWKFFFQILLFFFFFFFFGFFFFFKILFFFFFFFFWFFFFYFFFFFFFFEIEGFDFVSKSLFVSFFCFLLRSLRGPVSTYASTKMSVQYCLFKVVQDFVW